MKIIFLDIDGVLNAMSVPRLRQPGDDYSPHILPDCVRAFNKIIKATDAKIVISSTWRGWFHNGHMDHFGFQRLLKTHGIRGELLGFTRESEGGEPRWTQIRDWLRTGVCGTDYRYCIIDDDPGAFGGRPGVQTNGNGLTEADADLAVEILNA